MTLHENSPVVRTHICRQPIAHLDPHLNADNLPDILLAVAGFEDGF